MATTVRRALQRATGFKDYEWQLIRGPELAPVQQMAMDEVLATEAGAGTRKPTLRIWEWNSPAVVIGSFQSVKNEVDGENAKKYGFDVVRRISGGGAMFMEAGSVITYSIYAPTELVGGMTFADSYAFLDEWVITALRSLGIEASYVPLNDITSPTGKIGGAAQKRLGSGAVLHHVTMSYDMDGEKMVQVLRIGREKISDKGIASAAKRVDPLRSQTGLSRAEIIDRMVDTLPRPLRRSSRARSRRTSRRARRTRRDEVRRPRRGSSACRDRRARPSRPRHHPRRRARGGPARGDRAVVHARAAAHRADRGDRILAACGGHPQRLGADG